MKIKKVDGTKRCYIMDNGDSVPFDELEQYKKKTKPKKRTYKRKKKTSINTRTIDESIQSYGEEQE